MAYNKFLLKLSQNFLEILDDDEYYDVIIEVGNDSYVKIFRAHMVILNYRSPYLRRVLLTNKKKDEGTSKHIRLPNILPETFQAILRYIYGGRLLLEKYDVSDIIKILIAANELNLQELITYLQSFLIENEKDWMEQNFDLIYRKSFEIDSFSELRKYCTNLISKEPDKIFKSLNFSLIPERLLVSLIRNDDDLKMSEIQIWERVLEWGIAQNPGLSSDPTRCSKDDFDALKNTLRQCIPFMKFHSLTSKEFSDKVLPYRKILPKELYMNLLKDFLDNDCKPIKKSEPRITKVIKKKIIDSKIISNQHVELITKWIDRDKLTSIYTFKLLFSGSRDGLTPKKFHEICDNQSRTVTIVKVKGSSEILGGYNPITWKFDDEFGITKDSFIFSFKNNDSTENCILSRVLDEKKAIHSRISYGPSFGDGDLLLYQSYDTLEIYCNETSYEKPIRITNGYVEYEEFEVFKCVGLTFIS